LRIGGRLKAFKLYELNKLNNMKRNPFQTTKRFYNAPLVERITLDNEISLQLASDPLPGPGESYNSAPEYFNNDPYKLT
jgi:hypothetical protein